MTLAAVADTPVLNVDITNTADNVLNASESGAATISGALDPSVASTLERIEITDGTTTVTVDKANITVAADGTYQTTADLSSLKDGALTVTAHATSHDGTTATSTDTITKDTVATEQDNSVSMNEDQPSIHGNLIVDDEAGVRVTAGLGEQQGNYGKFVIHADGSYTYTPDARAQALSLNEHQQETFTFTVTDKAGNTASETFHITLTGNNDAPVVASVISGQTATEDGAYTFSVPAGTFTDVDATDSLTLSATGAPSWATFDPATGTFTGTPSNGDVGTTQVTVTATDSQGATVSTTFNLVVNNTNDAPTLNTIATATATEDGSAVSGQLTATDPDTGDTLSYSASTTDGLTFKSDGSYTFDPSNAAYQSLPNGQTQTLTIPVTVTDSAGATDTQNLTITITGTNDVPTIAGVSTQTVTEDTTLTASGQLTISDADAGEAVFQTQTGASTRYGHFSVDATGQWTYNLENSNQAVQSLGVNESLTDRIAVTSADGTVHVVSVTINGTNDAPVVSSNVTLAAGTEDTAVTLTEAQLLAHASDVDRGETTQLSVHKLSADHGTITDNKDGTYTFTPEANYNGAVSLTYDVQDPQGATVAASASMTLAAVADTPVLNVDITNTADNVLNASESGAATISGALDPSVASTLERIEITDGTTTVTVDKANITVAADGTYQTTADLSSLKDGSLTVTAHATSHDGTNATATDTITKDASTTVTANLATASDTGSDHTDTFTKDNTPTIEGQAEAGAQVVIADAQGKVVGQGQADAAGHYSITTSTLPDDNMSGTKLTITSTDAAGNSASVDQTLYITTHLPPLRVDSLIVDTGVKGDLVTQFHGKGSNLNIDIQGMDPTAHIEYSLDGGQSWSTKFTPQDGLNDFQVRQVDLAGNVSVGTPVHYTIDNTVAAPNVDLVNDSGSSSSDLITQNGSLNVAGTEAGATVEYSVDGGKNWSTTFTPQEGANNVQVRQTDVAGNVSPSSHISFRLDTAATVHDNSARMNEDQPGTHGNLIVDDEAGAQVTGGLGEQQGNYGKFVIHADGSYTYTPDARAQALSLNEHKQETFSFTVTDKAGNTATETFQIELTGRNDAPVITGDTSGQIIEDGPKVAVSGVLATQDPDAGESSSLTPLNNQAGQYGHLTLQADGHWVYTLDNANANVQDLKQGQTVQEAFVVTAVSNDGTHTTQTLIIDVEGAADKPVLHALSDSGPQHSGPIEGNIITGLGTDQGASAAATDSDSNANLVLHDIQVHDTNAGRYVTITPGNPYTMAGVGTMTIEANGHYVFDPVPGFTGRVPPMTYRVVDTGGSSTQGESTQNVLDLEVTPGHMGPATLAALTGGGSSMSGTLVSASGVTGGWGIQDPSTGASTHAHHGQYGSLSIDPNTGMVSYHVDGGHQGVQKTGTGVTGDVVEHFVITQGGSATTQVDVDVFLSAVGTHGHSGHYVQHITVKDLDASALPNVQHDEPDPIDDPSDIQTVTLDLDDTQGHELDFGRLDALKHKAVGALDEGEMDERAAKVFGSASDNEADDALQAMVSAHLAEHDAAKKSGNDADREGQHTSDSDGDNNNDSGKDSAEQAVFASNDHSGHDDSYGGSSSSHMDSLVPKPDDDTLPPI